MEAPRTPRQTLVEPDRDVTDPTELEIDDATLAEWQGIVDLMAELADVPAGLIMRLTGDDIEVFLSSRTEGNPYEPGDAEHFADSGLYCETVINTRDGLLVADAPADPEWADNPDIEFGMISYLGYPILLPNGVPFGTICVLDRQPNAYPDRIRGLIPICAWCKKIKDDDGYWNAVETYLARHPDSRLIHAICPDCASAAEERTGTDR